jgi:hypothetical protein
MSGTPPPWAQKYIAHIADHGPLPRNFTAVGRHDEVLYKVQAGSTSKVYPMSPKGRAEGLSLSDELQLGRKDHLGAFFPLISYRASEWVWMRHEHHAGALYAALSSSGAQKNMQPATYGQVAADIGTWKGLTPALWHPADRGTPIFENEEKVAGIAELYGRSVIIVCPRIMEEAQWNRIWDPVPSVRPAVYMRWSVGVQANHPYIILGCLPQRNKSAKRSAVWFTMKPLGATKDAQSRLWKRQVSFHDAAITANESTRIPNNAWDILEKSVAFPNLPRIFLQWTAVAVHRTYLWSTSRKFSAIEVGNWMFQYGNYILSNRPTGGSSGRAKPFEWDQSMAYPGKKIHFQLIDLCITSSPAGSPVRRFAEQWDNAIEAKIQYDKKKNPTQTETRIFSETLSKVSYIPLWKEI